MEVAEIPAYTAFASRKKGERVTARLIVRRVRTRPGAVAAGKAYSSRANRAHLHKHSIKAVIPEKKDQVANCKKKGSRGGRPVTFDAGLYRDRSD
ncbi:hypothetical protein ACH4CE_32160 [Streptomyces gelaticus]|uniref:hypothetical protein n=1 Tax=Streptomyces gelaticus TaxID=285446 RepID=UPI0037B4D095